MSYNINWKTPWLANLQRKSVDVTVFPSVRILYNMLLIFPIPR